MTEQDSNLERLQSRLNEAKSRVNTLTEQRIFSVEMSAEYRKAHDLQLAAERALSLAKGEPTALSCDWSMPWSIGSPMPHVFANGLRLILLYSAGEAGAKWDEAYIRGANNRAPNIKPFVMVEFKGPCAHRFGSPNDEVIEGHPLYGRGLEAHCAHEVANSPWIREIQAINSVHSQYRAEAYAGLKHFILCFHDNMFECLAESFSIKLMRASFAQAIAEATSMLQPRA